jgi:hypothetical protein
MAGRGLPQAIYPQWAASFEIIEWKSTKTIPRRMHILQFDPQSTSSRAAFLGFNHHDGK